MVTGGKFWMPSGPELDSVLKEGKPPAAATGVVTSFATSVGTRDSTGAWTTDQAERLLEYTRSVGGRIVAAEFMNEPNFAAMGGAPNGYSAADFGRDFKVFAFFARTKAPDLLILGPGSVGETPGEWGKPETEQVDRRLEISFHRWQ